MMDIRLLSFGKWHVPKKSSIKDIDNKDFNYVCFGAYDFINLFSISCDENSGLSVYDNMYNSIVTKQNNISVDSPGYIERQIVLFGVDNGISIEHDKPLFVTLINSRNMPIPSISSDDSAPRKNIDMEEEIKKIYKSKNCENNYHLYYTLECADYVLITQDVEISDYCDIIDEINFNSVIGSLINDTATLFCLPTLMFKTPKDIVPQMTNGNKFHLELGIGVKDTRAVSCIKENEFLKCRNLTIRGINLGRDDYILSMEMFSYQDLAYLLSLIDTYSSDNALFITTMESRIGRYDVCIPNTLETSSNVDFEALVQNIKDTYNCFDCAAKAHIEKVDCRMQVKETANAIIYILRSIFAVSFLPCVYKPFCSFLNYSINFLNEYGNSDEELYKYEQFCMDFLNNIKRLMFSTIHSTHHSIQAMTCNSFYFDVAPKLLSFYSIYVNELIQKVGLNSYTFMFSPDINKSIFLSKIYPETIENNIVTITIGESSFYNPAKLINLLNHEVGHFVSDDIGDKKKSRECIAKIAVYYLLASSIPKCASGFADELANEVFNSVIKERLNDQNSLDDLANEISVYLLDDNNRDEIAKAVSNAVSKNQKFKKEVIKELSCIVDIDYTMIESRHGFEIQAVNWLTNYIGEGLSLIINDESERNQYTSKIDKYIYVIREGFSDLFMNKISPLSEEEYMRLWETQPKASDSEELFMNANELRQMLVCNLLYSQEVLGYDVCIAKWIKEYFKDQLEYCWKKISEVEFDVSFSKEDISTIKDFLSPKETYSAINNGIMNYISRL